MVEFQNGFVHVLLWVIVSSLVPFNLLKVKILLHILRICHLTWLFLNFVVKKSILCIGEVVVGSCGGGGAMI